MKRGIWNDQVSRGRNKGSTETRMPNNKTREVYDSMKWNSPQLCEVCWCKPCRCKENKDNG